MPRCADARRLARYTRSPGVSRVALERAASRAWGALPRRLPRCGAGGASHDSRCALGIPFVLPRAHGRTPARRFAPPASVPRKQGRSGLPALTDSLLAGRTRLASGRLDAGPGDRQREIVLALGRRLDPGRLAARDLAPVDRPTGWSGRTVCLPDEGEAIILPMRERRNGAEVLRHPFTGARVSGGVTRIARSPTRKERG